MDDSNIIQFPRMTNDPKPPWIRVRVNVSQETADQLKWLMEDGDTNATNIIRRAIGTLYFLKQALKSGKEYLALVKKGWARQETRLELLD